jgi:catechol 2,3-dioxygenase-like lactoylglutathione lyase family enzyme
MSSIDVRSKISSETPRPGTIDMKLEVVTLPVADVERTKRFYSKLGWRLDGDFTVEGDFRVVQFTPPNSQSSVAFGSRDTTAEPGSTQDLMLIVYDIDEARDDLISRGVEVSEVFHYESRPFHSAGTEARVPGPDPQGRSYFTWASFSDPDGNGYLLQEIKERLSGREWED